MDLDSATILTRWLTEPTSRTFTLDQLTVLTARSGDEPDITRRLTENHPLLPGAENADDQGVHHADDLPDEPDTVMGKVSLIVGMVPHACA